MLKKHLNHPDRFCLVCVKYMRKEQQKNTTHDVKKMYMIYLGCPLEDQDKTRASHKYARNAV